MTSNDGSRGYNLGVHPLSVSESFVMGTVQNRLRAIRAKITTRVSFDSPIKKKSRTAGCANGL